MPRENLHLEERSQISFSIFNPFQTCPSILVSQDLIKYLLICVFRCLGILEILNSRRPRLHLGVQAFARYGKGGEGRG